MYFALKIESSNDAMQSLDDVALRLEKIAERMYKGEDYGPILDANGNTVGDWVYVDEA